MIGWDEIESAVRECDACRLCDERHSAVPGEGRRDADIMLIGEGPGEQEDLSGRPFVGPAGQLLDKMLNAIGLKREDVFICNVVKCRPPRNRDPLPGEQDLCIGYLRAQVKLIRPKIIVCLGRISAMRLIRPDYRITREHGQWIQKAGVWITAVYHPSLLLRDPRKKEDMLIDMKAIKARLEELTVPESGAENADGESTKIVD